MKEKRRRGRGDIGEMGARIREAVPEALDSMYFGQLNQAISDTVNSALNEAKKQAEYCRDKTENASWLPKGRQGGSKGEELFFSRPAPLKIQVNWKGRVSGILFAVFGALGSGVFGFLTVAALVTMFTVLQNPFGWWLTCFSGALLGKSQLTYRRDPMGRVRSPYLSGRKHCERMLPLVRRLSMA